MQVVHHFSNPRGTDVLMAESTLVTVLGGLAAALTSLAYLPQVKKAWPRGSARVFEYRDPR